MYIYGKNVVNETIKTRKQINKAFLYKKFNEPEIIDYLNKNGIPVKYLEKYEIDKMIDGNHQGVVLSVPDYKYCDIDDFINKDNALIVMLDHLEDPHNFGAIIRTCEAAGVDGIIIPKDRSVDVNSTVVRVSVGALDYQSVAMVTNLNSTIDYLKKKGFWIVGTDMNGTDYGKLDYSGKICIVIGNEGNGMSRLVRESCDFIASIPMRGKTNSLNASVATGIVIYEAIKARR